VTNPLRIPCRRARASRAGPWLRSRVGLFTVTGAFALTATVAGADILADRLSDRRISSASVIQLGSFNDPLTLGSTDDEARRFNLSEEFAPLSVITATRADRRAAAASLRAEHRGRSDAFRQFIRPDPGHAVGGVASFDTIVPTPNDPFVVLRWTWGSDVVALALPIAGVGLDHHGS